MTHKGPNTMTPDPKTQQTWQPWPPKMVPTDWLQILATADGGWFCIMIWDEYAKEWLPDTEPPQGDLTHWMPIQPTMTTSPTDYNATAKDLATQPIPTTQDLTTLTPDQCIEILRVYAGWGFDQRAHAGNWFSKDEGDLYDTRRQLILAATKKLARLAAADDEEPTT